MAEGRLGSLEITECGRSGAERRKYGSFGASGTLWHAGKRLFPRVVLEGYLFQQGKRS